MNGNDKIKTLHENLTTKWDGFNVPFDQFVKDMQNEENLISLHKNLTTKWDGFNVPYDQFKTDMLGGSKKKEQPDQQANRLQPFQGSEAEASASPSQGGGLGSSESPEPTKEGEEGYFTATPTGKDVDSDRPDITGLHTTSMIDHYPPELVERIGLPMQEARAKFEEMGDGFWSEMNKRLQKGGNELGIMLSNIPSFLYDVAAIPQNKLAELIDEPWLKATSEGFADQYVGGAKNKISEYYEKRNEILESELKQINKKYNQGIIESFEKGEIGSGLRNLAGGILESLQPSAAIMVGGGSMGAPGVIGVSSAMFGAGEYQETKKDPTLSESDKTIIALTKGLLEGLFETALGYGAVGKALKNIATKLVNKEVALSNTKEYVVDFFSKMIEKVPAMAPLGEGFEEAATQISQNAVDKYIAGKNINVMERVGDAFLIGMGMGTGGAASIYTAKQVFKENNPDMADRFDESASEAKKEGTVEQPEKEPSAETEQAPEKPVKEEPAPEKPEKEEAVPEKTPEETKREEPEPGEAIEEKPEKPKEEKPKQETEQTDRETEKVNEQQERQDIEAKKADIERRRQEELSSSNQVKVSRRKYTFTDDAGEKQIVIITEMADGSGIIERFSEEVPDKPYDKSRISEIQMSEGKLEYTIGAKDKYNIQSDGTFQEFEAKDVHTEELLLPKSKAREKINAKYDAELNALENSQTTSQQKPKQEPEAEKKPKEKDFYDEFTEQIGAERDMSDVVDKQSKMGKIGKADVIVDKAGENRVKIETVRVPESERQQGEASRAVDKLIEQADKQGLTLELKAAPEEGSQMTEAQLKEFYEKKGFEFEGNVGVREPKVTGKEIEPVEGVKTNITTSVKEVIGTEKYKDINQQEALLINKRFSEKDEIKGEFKEDSEKTIQDRMIEKLEEKGYIEYESGIDAEAYRLTDKGKGLLDAIKTRMETRKGVKEGTDLFPEYSNIPEINKKVKKEIDQSKKDLDEIIEKEPGNEIAKRQRKSLEEDGLKAVIEDTEMHLGELNSKERLTTQEKELKRELEQELEDFKQIRKEQQDAKGTGTETTKAGKPEAPKLEPKEEGRVRVRDDAGARVEAPKGEKGKIETINGKEVFIESATSRKNVEAALSSVNTPKKLEARLREEVSTMKGKEESKQSNWSFDKDNGELVYKDGVTRLTWDIRKNPKAPESTRNQQTKVGSVQLKTGKGEKEVKPKEPKPQKPDRKVEADKKIAEGFDELMSALGGKKSIIGEGNPIDNPSVYKAITKIAKGLYEKAEIGAEELFKQLLDRVKTAGITATHLSKYREKIAKDVGIKQQSTEGDTRMFKVAERVLKSDIDPVIKRGLQEEGANYVPKKREISRAEAQAYLETFRSNDQMEKAFNHVIDTRNKMSGDVRVALGTLMWKDYMKQADLQKASDMLNFLKLYGRDSGRTVNAFKELSEAIREEYGEEFLLYDAKKTIDSRLAQDLADKKGIDEYKIEKSLDEFMSNPEIKKIIEQRADKKIEEYLSNRPNAKERGRRIANKIRSAKINPKEYAFVTIVPPQVLNMVIETVARIVDRTGDIIFAIEQGIKKMRDTDFYKNLDQSKRSDLEKKFFNTTLKKFGTKEDLPPEAKKINEKWVETLEGLNSEKRKEVISKALFEIYDTGYLGVEKMQTMIGEALGMKTYTPKIDKQIRESLDIIRNNQELYDNYIESPTNANWRRYQKSLFKTELAQRKMDILFQERKGAGDALALNIKGGLLTTSSLLANVYGYSVMPVRFTKDWIGGGADFLRANTAKFVLHNNLLKNSKIARYMSKSQFWTPERTTNVFIKQPFYIRGLAEGTKTGLRQLITGVPKGDLSKVEVRKILSPLTALKRIPKDAKKLKFYNLFTDMVEGVPGMGAETMFRLLNLGDKPFSTASYRAGLAEYGWSKGLRGKDLKKFVRAPESFPEFADPGKELAEINRQYNTYQKQIKIQTGKGREVNLSNLINKLNHAIDGMADKNFPRDKKITRALNQMTKDLGRIGITSTVPYVQTPVNIFAEAWKLALPEVTMAQAFINASKGHNKAFANNFGMAATGFMLRSAATYLLSQGLITSLFSDPGDDKEREIAYDKGAPDPGSINISAIKRGILTGDYNVRSSDTWLRYHRLGTLGILTGAHAQLAKDFTRDELNHMIGSIKGLYTLPNLAKSAFQTTFLQGTNAFLNAFKGNQYEAEKFALNLINASSSGIYPNQLTLLSKMQDDKMREVGGADFGEKIKNLYKQKTFQTEKLEPMFNLWGEPVESIPKGTNKIKYQLLGVTKPYVIDTKVFSHKLYEMWDDLYHEVGDKDMANKVFPSQPNRNFYYQGEYVKLSNKLYAELQRLIGEQRSFNTREYLNEIGDNYKERDEYVKITDDLKKIYENSSSYARDYFRNQYAHEIIELWMEQNKGKRLQKPAFLRDEDEEESGGLPSGGEDVYMGGGESSIPSGGESVNLSGGENIDL